MNAISPRHARTRGFRAHLTPPQWRGLIAAGSTAAFPRGSRLLDQGDHRPLVYALEQGRVRVVYTEPDGNEILIAIRGPGDLIGEYAQRDRGDHMASVWALEACVATVLHSDPFDRFLDEHQLDDALQRYMLYKARQGAQRLWRIANLHAEQRLAQLFLEVVNADAGQGDQVVPMSQQLVANSLGVTRRSINERLSQWRNRGLVRTRPGAIEILDLPALARLANLHQSCPTSLAKVRTTSQHPPGGSPTIRRTHPTDRSEAPHERPAHPGPAEDAGPVHRRTRLRHQAIQRLHRQRANSNRLRLQR